MLARGPRTRRVSWGALLMMVTLLLGWSLVVSGGSGRAYGDPARPLTGLGALEQRLWGRKFEQESQGSRIQRLEQALNLSAAPTSTSTTYRLARIYTAQTETGRRHARQEAVDVYNQGVDAALKGGEEAAMALYRRAIALDPTMLEAYNNLGAMLLQRLQYDETGALYEQALALHPQEPVLYRNLGILYEKTGRIAESIRLYERYLSMITHADPPIEAVVATYRQNQARAGSAPDYVAAATQASHGRVLVWPARRNPIQVYVQLAHPDQAVLIPILEQAMRDWEQATSGRLRFQRTPQPRQAHILVVLRPGPLMDPYADIGHTSYEAPVNPWRQRDLDFVTVTLNTGTPENHRQFPADSLHAQMYRMALHELGHAIGIWGHSADPNDIMFTHPIAAGLSARDVRTIQRLYGLNHPTTSASEPSQP